MSSAHFSIGLFFVVVELLCCLCILGKKTHFSKLEAFLLGGCFSCGCPNSLNRKCDSLYKLHLCSHEFSSTHKSLKLMPSSSVHFASFYISQRSLLIQCPPHVITHPENVEEWGPSMLFIHTAFSYFTKFVTEMSRLEQRI